MPTILSRLRGLVAPSTPDQPLRLADAGGVVVTPGSSSSGGGGGGRSGEDGKRGRSIRGRRGINGANGTTGATGASGGQQFGAYWVALAGGAITLPLNSVERVMNASGTIKEILVLTKGGTGNCTIKIWKAAFSSHYPPIVTDDITAGANVVISSGTTHDDSTLTGFTTAFSQGDVYLLTLSAVAGFTSVGIFLRI